MTLPNLSLSGGHASADGMATSGGGAAATGDFAFKGSSGSVGWLQTLAPVIVAAVAIWFIVKK
ncbi:hypothetical protein [uncultured Celeribacter sp.]|uniref:hypothetical protein n=1 Tax=uncultured Celeribacter sp. TaxID=1303376 RepID=UPI002AA641B7|nr:hypothetical protein [uncultured Celeribacter sp.]